MFAIRRAILLFFNLLFPRVKLPVFGYCTFNCLNYRILHCISRCEKINENTGTPVNILYNYGLHEKLISIIIKLRKGYFPEVRRTDGK